MPPWAGPCGGARAVLSLLPDGARVGHEQHELRAQRSALVVGDEQEQQRADVTRARSVTSRSSSALRMSLAQRIDPLGCTSVRHADCSLGKGKNRQLAADAFCPKGRHRREIKSDCVSVHYVGCRELATIEAHTVANHPQPRCYNYPARSRRGGGPPSTSLHNQACIALLRSIGTVVGAAPALT